MKHLNQYTSLGDALFEKLTTHPQHLGLIEANRDKETQRLTYQDIHSQAIHVAKTLQYNQIHAGDHVAIIMTNQARWNISAIGVLYAGGVLVPIDYKLSALEQIELIEHSDAKIVILEFYLFKRIKDAQLLERLNGLKMIVSEAPLKFELQPPSHQRWDQNTDHLPFEMIHRRPEDTATVVYSSGTFGTPKGCMMTHQNYLSQAHALSELFPVDQRHTYFSFIPTNHAIDFMCGFFMPLVNQSKTVHQRTLRPEFIAPTIAKYQVTHMALVPLLLNNLRKKLQSQFDGLPFFKSLFLKMCIAINRFFTQRRPNYAVSKILLAPVHKKFGNSLQYIFVGGAFTDPDLAQFFYDLGFSASIGYGLTEAGTVVSVNDLEPFTTTAGKPLAITNVEIRNSTAVLGGCHGDIWVSGPTVMKGYFKNDELTQSTIIDGWLDTGDIGILSNDGYLDIVGRKKNMIVTSGGKNIYPEELEKVFSDLNFEAYCVFAGSYLFPEDQDIRDQLVLVAQLSQHQNATLALPDIQKQNQLLPEHKRIQHVIFWPEDFPQTATMKIKRPALARRIQESEVCQLRAL